MNFFDVVFPLNIGHLTYMNTEKNIMLKPGMVVRAEVKKTIRTGLVTAKNDNPPKGRIKEITEIVTNEPVFDEPMLNLLKWISDYYIAQPGLALKSVFPMEIFERFSERQDKKNDKEKNELRRRDTEPLPEVADGINSVRASISSGQYKTFLFHAPAMNHELSFVLNAASGVGNAIILVPETANLRLIIPYLANLFGKRLSVFHGGMTKKQKRYALKGILSGESDIVVGTRPAVFAPLRRISFIAVLHEHSRSYKNLEGLRYNARDVAVMRGYLNKATILLSSITPSLESFYNARKGKYIALNSGAEIKRPRVEIINMKTSARLAPYLSKRAIEAAKSFVNNKEGVLFLINRKGYSLIQCRDCGYIPACRECGIPLVYHRDRGLLRCHCCGSSIVMKDSCAKCSGASLDSIGAGTQRIASDVKKYLDVEPLRIDKDELSKKNASRASVEDEGIEGLIVGTKIFAKKMPQKGALGLCVFLNPDSGLNFPDFRSSELLFQELSGISGYLKGGGLFIIQTVMPANHVYRSFRKYGYSLFCEEELAKRQSLSYPPFSRLTLLSVSSKADVEKDLIEFLKKTSAETGDSIEVMGPVRAVQKGSYKWKILLKSAAKVRLNTFVRVLLKKTEKRKDMGIIADVDPISI